ncbi:hypothetical protein ACIQGO_08285 [Streptomyces shenzhenensis]|uniref:hypothetical protein n=1 Tax=Streptomyces shenzhenensis TaxID=943815 RepID=UPI003813D03C
MSSGTAATFAGEFRKQVARAELERQFNSPTANRLFSELSAGVNQPRPVDGSVDLALHTPPRR